MARGAQAATDYIDEQERVEDILLGSLGYGEEARIVSIEVTSSGYRGVGRFPDGEQFEFRSDDELDELQRWALERAASLFQGK